MPRPLYDAIFWTNDAAGATIKTPHQVPLTLHIQLSPGHPAQQEHNRKARSGYKIAFRVRTNQTVDIAFVEEGTNSPISHVDDTAGAGELQTLYAASGEKWVAFRLQAARSREPNFPGGGGGIHAEYRATLSIDPLAGPQAILCAHANGNESYTDHHILSTVLAV